MTLFFVFPACKGKRSPGGSSGADSANPGSSVQPKATRAGLIAALRDLNRRAGSGDSTVVADIYDFPVPDSVMNLFLDSAFDVIKTKNGGVVPKSVFFTYYDRLHVIIPTIMVLRKKRKMRIWARTITTRCGPLPSKLLQNRCGLLYPENRVIFMIGGC